MRVVPPGRGSISLRPMNQESMPGPVAMAAQTASGVAGRSMSWVSWNSWVSDMSGLLGRSDARMNGDDDPVLAAAGGVLVVVAAHERGHGRGELLGERGPVGGRGEAHGAVEGEGGHRPA